MSINHGLPAGSNPDNFTTLLLLERAMQACSCCSPYGENCNSRVAIFERETTLPVAAYDRLDDAGVLVHSTVHTSYLFMSDRVHQFLALY